MLGEDFPNDVLRWHLTNLLLFVSINGLSEEEVTMGKGLGCLKGKFAFSLSLSHKYVSCVTWALLVLDLMCNKLQGNSA